MAAQDSANIFLTCSQQFWIQICRQATRRPYNKQPQGPLHHHCQTERQYILWYYTQLGLFPPQSHPIYAMIFQKGAAQVQASATTSSITCTWAHQAHPLWQQIKSVNQSY